MYKSITLSESEVEILTEELEMILEDDDNGEARLPTFPRVVMASLLTKLKEANDK
jgi:hypothetical protein